MYTKNSHPHFLRDLIHFFEEKKFEKKNVWDPPYVLKVKVSNDLELAQLELK